MKQSKLERTDQFLRRVRVQGKVQQVSQRVHPQHGVSEMLDFAGVDQSVCGSSLDRHIGGLCVVCSHWAVNKEKISSGLIANGVFS